jgi:IS5 family transposase
MGIARWNPPQALSSLEKRFVKRMARTGKLFAFLREQRHAIFDESFQDELAAMYRDTGAGAEAVAPGLMAMATLLQGYLGASDAEMVELTVFDARVQMVLGCIGAQQQPFSQGTFSEFRARLIRHDMDRRLLERSVEVARASKGFDPKKLPKTLRVAIDSKPLEGAGRVEDTFNLLGHAARKVVDCAAALLKWKAARVCKEAGVPVLLESSVKKGLDVDWNDAEEKAEAIKVLTAQLTSLVNWLQVRLPEELAKPPLSEDVATLRQILEQNTEPDPDGGGLRIIDGVAEDRRVSVEDADIRHGRKSKSKRFNGFKQHLAADLDSTLILAAVVTAANRAEATGAQPLAEDMARMGVKVRELYIDRGYINAPIVDDVLARRGEVFCKPWQSRNGTLFPKSAFRLNMGKRTITCPNDQTQHFEVGDVVEFDSHVCDNCPLRAKCTTAEEGSGRTVSIADNEALQQRFRKRLATREGRSILRRRVGIEHRLAHLARRQGPRARYRGIRKNTFDVRRAAAIQNLETAQRTSAHAAKAA